MTNRKVPKLEAPSPNSISLRGPTLVRKILYAATASVLALALLAAATEVILRVGGYGYSAHFVREVRRSDGQRVWRENRWCTAPYFSPALVRRPQPFRLPLRKADGSYRVFVLGSSAAMGDPEASFSLARMLETMLSAAYPGIRFEVVNAGITAINSHIVRSIAEDCARLQPDLFIVYEGNNEVIGPFGPAGVLAPFLRHETAVRLAAWAETTRTGQWLNAVGRALRRGNTGAVEWGGMQMFLDQQIDADDPRLDNVRTLFRANLLAIARTAHEAGAPVLFCTVLTNQRDFAPFMSRHRPDLSAADLGQWNAHLSAGITAERSGDLNRAEGEFRQALALDDHYAELLFRLGRLALQQGHDAEARDLLQRALDRDTLRFRTDSTLNATIRAVSTLAPGATLVDIAKDLAASCAHGIPGDELLYEHVHLTFRGTYEVAARLFPRIGADLARRGLIKEPAERPIAADEARQRLAFTTYEQAMIGLELLRRFRAPPFTGQADQALRLASWEHRLAAANTLLQRPDASAALLAVYQGALRHAPDDWVLLRNEGAMLVARGHASDAIAPLERALTFIDDDADTLVALGLAYRDSGQAAKANLIFDRVRALEPTHPLLPK